MEKLFLIFYVSLTILLRAVRINANIYCANHTYGSSFNTTHMQFTKEMVEQEYAIEGEFKGLHCCSKGYRSIEW
jgi:hypothetical protein